MAIGLMYTTFSLDTYQTRGFAKARAWRGDRLPAIDDKLNAVARINENAAVLLWSFFFMVDLIDCLLPLPWHSAGRPGFRAKLSCPKKNNCFMLALIV
jgi:hypothetical protein